MNEQPVSYLQTDLRWAKINYSAKGESTTIGASGCGPTSAAMLLATLTGKSITPKDTCAWSLDHGFKACNQGTYYTYFAPQFAAYGLLCKRLNTANLYGQPNSDIHEQAIKLLKDGWYLIACMGKGNWTSSGHFVVVWWADGVFYINDPASQKTDRLRGDAHTFRSQVKYYFAVDATKHNTTMVKATTSDSATKEAINALVKAGVISSADYWTAHAGDVQYVTDLLQKAAKKITKAGPPAATVNTALVKLQAAGIVSSPSYWLQHIGDMKYLDDLIKKLGGSV